MRILPYLSPCCAVLAARFSNLTIFECSHRRHVIAYTNDIFNNKCKRPHYATRKNSNLYIENKYHQLTLQKKFRLLLNKGVHGLIMGFRCLQLRKRVQWWGHGRYDDLPCSVIVSVSQTKRKTTFLWNITFIFSWCLCNWAMVTPVKYEYDPDDIPNEELTERGPPLLTWINFYPIMDK